jgi:hypothetical protein
VLDLFSQTSFGLESKACERQLTSNDAR